jgi:arylsulfatase
MNNYTERTCATVTIREAIKDLMKTYVKDAPRKLQSMSHSGPITLSGYQVFQYVREGISILLPTGHQQGNTPPEFR